MIKGTGTRRSQCFFELSVYHMLLESLVQFVGRSDPLPNDGTNDATECACHYATCDMKGHYKRVGA